MPRRKTAKNGTAVSGGGTFVYSATPPVTRRPACLVRGYSRFWVPTGRIDAPRRDRGGDPRARHPGYLWSARSAASGPVRASNPAAGVDTLRLMRGSLLRLSLYIAVTQDPSGRR